VAGACRHWLWRQGDVAPAKPHAGFGCGGRVTWHTCRRWPRRQGVFFDKFFGRWSFLAFHSRRWSYLSKIRRPRCRPRRLSRTTATTVPPTPRPTPPTWLLPRPHRLHLAACSNRVSKELGLLSSFVVLPYLRMW
jgi:hypothetical protein